MLKFLLIVSVFILAGCTVEKEPTPTKQEVKQPQQVQERTYQSVQTDYNSFSNYSNGCNYRTKDSINCRIKRIQNQLGIIESNIKGINEGIGNCRDCNSY